MGEISLKESVNTNTHGVFGKSVTEGLLNMKSSQIKD